MRIKLVKLKKVAMVLGLIILLTQGLFASRDTFIFHINYNNQCIGCLAPIKSFYLDQKQKENAVLFIVDNLEFEYVKEYLYVSTGLDSIYDEEIVQLLHLENLGIENVREHTVYKIRNGKVLYRQLCVAFFQEFKETRLNPRLDSFRVKGDFSGLKYRDLYTKRLDEDKYLLISSGYEESIHLYSRIDERLTDVLGEIRSSQAINEIYSAYFNAKEAKQALAIRNHFLKRDGRLGRYKEFSLENVKSTNQGHYLSFKYCFAFPDSTVKTTILIIHYSNNFKLVDFWVQEGKPALGHYFISLTHGDNYFLDADKIILPVYYSGESFPNPAYNLGEFVLAKQHKIEFKKLLNFYEPLEKQLILGTRMYNMFSARSIFKTGDSISVVYNLMPFVYQSGNVISDTLTVVPNLFLDPKFKAINDSTRNQNGTFSMAYFQTISRIDDYYLSVSFEFKHKRISLYNLDFDLLSRMEINDPTNEIFPMMNGSKLVYLRRWPSVSGDVYIYSVDLGISNFD